MREATPGSVSTRATAPAKACAVSATSRCSSCCASSPSQPIVVETTGPDLLTHPSMEALLKGTKQVYLFGLFADEAVLKAARELRRMGLAVVLVTNATCTRSQEPNALEAAIADIVALGAERKTTMEVMTRYAAVKRH